MGISTGSVSMIDQAVETWLIPKIDSIDQFEDIVLARYSFDRVRALCKNYRYEF
jgi:hypothetical protein